MLDVVKSEYHVATTLDNEIQPEKQDFLKENGYEVIQRPGESHVQLLRKLSSGEQLRVFFDIDEVVDVNFNNSAEEGAAESDEALEDELLNYDSTFAHVKVFLSNEAKNNGILFNLLLQSSEDEMLVDDFNFKPDAAAFLKQVNESGSYTGQFEYQGPRFSNLDESLQTTVEKFLSSRGINSELVDFIFHFSEVKEEDSYRSFLTNVAKYLEQ